MGENSVNYARDLIVAKRNDMLQNARFNLNVQEQRVILYTVAQIKPDDTYLKEYTFEIKDFYKTIGWKNQSYTEFKQMLKALSDKSWTITVSKDGEEWDSVVRWFTTVRSNKKSGKVVVKFHEDMFPYLIELSKQYALTGQHYTQYELKYTLAMQSKFSPRLYELLKSYQKNNIIWFFNIDDLQSLLCDCDKSGKPIVPAGWKNFAIFKRDVLNIAIKEINEYTDLHISYTTQKEGRKITKVQFGMIEKTKAELLTTEKVINEALDGPLSFNNLNHQNS